AAEARNSRTVKSSADTGSRRPGEGASISISFAMANAWGNALSNDGATQCFAGELGGVIVTKGLPRCKAHWAWAVCATPDRPERLNHLRVTIAARLGSRCYGALDAMVTSFRSKSNGPAAPSKAEGKRPKAD